MPWRWSTSASRDVAASSSAASDVSGPSRPIARSAASRPSRFHSDGDGLPTYGLGQRLHLLLEELADRLGEVLVAQDLVALGVDRLALLVDDVVELDDALADVEVEALDAGLGALDRLATRACDSIATSSSRPRRSMRPATRSEANRFIRSSSSDR